MEKIRQYWLDIFQEDGQVDWWERKKRLCEERKIEIVRVNGYGTRYHQLRQKKEQESQYHLHLIFLMKQGDFFYHEEQVIPHAFHLVNNEIIHHERIDRQSKEEDRQVSKLVYEADKIERQDFQYDRRAAVKYAEHWWNNYHPDFPIFEVDCTNYVSQCLLAGGAFMHGAPVRERGWWFQAENWSFSWAVAHSMRWYLSGANEGLIGKEVETASELQAGDVICYDFQGDGRWDHTTIVVDKDQDDMPLVNAHTENSRYRYWSYEDSTAWTPKIKYKFFQIGK